MKRQTGRLTSICVGIGVLAAVGAAPVHAETLEEELRYLLESHPQLDVRKENLTAAEEGVDSAFSGFLPRVTLNGDAGWERSENPVLDATDESPWNTDRYRAGIEVRQNIYQGLRTTAELEAAEKGREAADIDLAFVEQQLLFEGITAYVNVEKFTFLRFLAMENEKTLKQQLRLEDERVQRGAGIEVDVLQAKSRLQRAIERRVGFEGNLKEAHARYLQVFGKSSEGAQLAEVVPPLDLLPASLDDSLERALGNNLQIRNGRVQSEIAETGKQVAASGYHPTVDAVARYNWEEDVDGSIGVEKNLFGGVELNWEIFSGFLTDSQVGQAAARHNSTLANLRYIQQKVEEEVRVAWRSLETAQERADLLENAVNIAAEVFIARQNLRDGGKETAINVLDAENELYSARIAQVGASYEARLAVFRLLLAIGELTPDSLGV
ncbi:TolC family protein [Sneathiella chinensis]|uniref:TolC family protein n=1 Tax=Sneathiella chinensis TaxID=349750 RepID=UPI00146C2012|nr:TolC family protein [Sneathiella chinensis]